MFQPDLIPIVRFENPPAGIAWLERTFGFERHLVIADGDRIVHAELRLGRGFLMCEPLRDDFYNIRTPRQCGGANTQTSYIATRDVEALYTKAEAAGTEIVRELAKTDYGSTDFAVRDPEGFLWYVGSYHPTVDGPEGDKADALPAELFGGARYANARGAIEFFKNAFGAEENYVVPGDGDTIAHAQLSFGSSIFMLGSGGADSDGLKTPAEIGGINTQWIYARVDDVDAHFARAEAAGALIVERPADTTYDSRAYTVRDCEGHLWNVGNYRPALVPA
jgi:uncharacterized glyoxalase superfamily protein PhnB